MITKTRVERIIPNEELLPKEMEIPSPIEGADLICELLPVSKVTGHRSNTLTLLQMSLSPKYQNLIPQILQELPTVNSDPDLTDKDRSEMLAFRLLSGTPSENEQFVTQMISVIGELTPKQAEKAVDTAQETISFVENEPMSAE